MIMKTIGYNGVHYFQTHPLSGGIIIMIGHDSILWQQDDQNIPKQIEKQYGCSTAMLV